MWSEENFQFSILSAYGNQNGGSFVCFVMLLNLIQLVLFHLICLFRTVFVLVLLIYSYLLDLVKILIFGVKRLKFSNGRKWLVVYIYTLELLFLI